MKTIGTGAQEPAVEGKQNAFGRWLQTHVVSPAYWLLVFILTVLGVYFG